jgi:hypothetical protein
MTDARTTLQHQRTVFDGWRSISLSLYMALVGYGVLVGIPVISTAWVQRLGFTEAEVGGSPAQTWAVCRWRPSSPRCWCTAATGASWCCWLTLRATGLSRPYCALIRRGGQLSHARHWEVLRALVNEVSKSPHSPAPDRAQPGSPTPRPAAASVLWPTEVSLGSRKRL